LVFFGAIGLGAGIRRLPRPVVAGFSTGIAVLVVSQRVPDLLGIGSQLATGRVTREALTPIRYAAQIEPHASILAVATLILMVGCRKASRYLPAGLIAVTAGALLVKFGYFPVRTIESLFGADLGPFYLHPSDAFRLDLLGSILAQGFAIAVLLMAPLLRFIPLPVISALILSSVFRMTNWREVFQFMKVPPIEAAAWAAISFLTIVLDLPIAIAVGLLIGMFLHIRKKQAILSKAAPGQSP
jgi:MFS superfamily sulfate permease-like transporter